GPRVARLAARAVRNRGRRAALAGRGLVLRGPRAPAPGGRRRDGGAVHASALSMSATARPLRRGATSLSEGPREAGGCTNERLRTAAPKGARRPSRRDPAKREGVPMNASARPPRRGRDVPLGRTPRSGRVYP